MSTLSQFSGGGGIKSVQSGVTTGTNSAPGTATISPVNTAKAFISIRGTSAGNIAGLYGVATLTDSTTVTVIQSNNNTQAYTVTVYWTVVEYY